MNNLIRTSTDLKKVVMKYIVSNSSLVGCVIAIEERQPDRRAKCRIQGF
jgi:hypothetical protein